MYRQQQMMAMNANANNSMTTQHDGKIDNQGIVNPNAQPQVGNPGGPQIRNVPPIIINLFPGNNPQNQNSNSSNPPNLNNTGTNPQHLSNTNTQFKSTSTVPRPMVNPMMYNRYPMMNPMMRQNMYNNIYSTNNLPNTNIQPTQQPQNNIKDLIQETITHLTSQNNNNEDSQDISSIKENTATYIYEKEYSLEDENLKQLWSGFITKNKKDRVGVDAYQIRNECNDFFTAEYNLNVSHRSQFDDIMKRPIIGIVAFSPQNETQCDSFNEYISYFNEKQRVGVVNMRSGNMLYIVPPCDFSRKFYQNPKKHLLGIFVNSLAEPKAYVDMNNLSLPPPVISLTEKRLLLKKNKKETSTTSANTSQDQHDLINQLSNMDNNKIGK
jgi:hypothetical protein